MSLAPKQKKMILLVGVPTALFFLYLMAVPGDLVKPVPTRNESETGVFDTNSQEMTVPALSTKINAVESQLDTTNQRLSGVMASQKRVEDLVENLSGNDQSVRSLFEINRKIEELNGVLTRLTNGTLTPRAPMNTGPQVVDENEDLIKENEEAEPAVVVPESTFIADEDPIDYSVSKTEIPNDPLAFVEQASKRNGVQQVTDNNMFITSEGGNRPISSVASTVIAIDENAKNEVMNANKPILYRGKRVLAGSVIPFTLISGFDAPTGKANSTDPVSATVRISGPALLPNGYTVDLTGCLITTLVRGNEATERASLRPDRLTCKYEYGEVDIAIQGYASGKDGSAGLRGRLVSRAQKALIYGTMAGVAEGLGNAFGGGGQSGNVNLGGGDPFALPSGDQALRSSALSGLSSGSEFLTDYYQGKLETLYDIIEIKPLVTGTIHILSTFETKLLSETVTSVPVRD